MSRAVVIAKKKPQYAPIMDAVQRTGMEIRDFNDDLSDLDYIIVFHNKGFEKLRTNAKVGWWICDYRSPERFGLQMRMDHIFLPYHNFHTEYSERFNVPVTFMPQCGVEWPMEQSNRKIEGDAVFIGNVSRDNKYHYNRAEILEEVTRLCHYVHITGEGTTTDMRHIYQQFPISISITPPGMAGASNRLYNILSSGGLCLTSWFEGIEQLFENNEHMVWFKDKKELFEIIEKLLTNTRDNLRIRTNGQLIYQEKHTAKARLDNMFDILEGTETEFRGYLND